MKTLTGTVVSNKMEKTIVVRTERLWEHPIYKKRVKRSSKIMVHSDKPVAEGLKVKISESKPMSKNKRWVLTEVLK